MPIRKSPVIVSDRTWSAAASWAGKDASTVCGLPLIASGSGYWAPAVSVIRLAFMASRAPCTCGTWLAVSEPMLSGKSHSRLSCCAGKTDGSAASSAGPIRTAPPQNGPGLEENASCSTGAVTSWS